MLEEDKLLRWIIASGMKTSIEKSFKSLVPGISNLRMREVFYAPKKV